MIRIRCALLVAVIACSPLFGAEGVVLITKPMTITDPGHYKVVRPLLVLGSDPVIRIIADRVTLDLNGHTLTNTGCPGAVIKIFAGIDRIVVRDGNLRGGGGIDADAGSGHRFERLSIETCKGDAIRAEGSVDILDCDIVSGDAHGIRVTGGKGSRIVNNRVKAQEPAITLRDIRGSEIVGNTIYDGDPGLSVIKSSGTSPSTGGGNLIQNNMIGPGSVEQGIHVNSSDNLIKNNLVSYCSSTGISVSGDRNHVLGNVVGKNDSHGIVVNGSYQLVEGNHVSGNNPCGILFGNDNGHVYRNNMLLDNKEGSVCGPANTDAGGNIISDEDDHEEVQPCNCCDAPNEAGCNCDECETIVCSSDPFCCEVFWESYCSDLALRLCDCCAGQTPGECGTTAGE